jgi:hypothetical protein
MNARAVHRALCGDPGVFDVMLGEGFTETALCLRSGGTAYPVGGRIVEGLLAFFTSLGEEIRTVQETVSLGEGSSTVGTWTPLNRTFPNPRALQRYLAIYGLEMGDIVPTSEAERLGYNSYGRSHLSGFYSPFTRKRLIMR